MLAREPSASVRALDGFVDSLLQTFENCRPGLNDRLLGTEGEAPENEMVNYLLGKAPSPPAVEPAPAPDTKR